MDHDHERLPAAEPELQAEAATAIAPGRRPATAGWPRRAVQRRAAPSPRGGAAAGPSLDPALLDAAMGLGSVPEVAAAGVAGAGGPLPHLDTIQRAFGRHDVGGVKAHVGGAAARSAATIGAEAYAIGDAVAFQETPSLHTAAHEAAHTVQQRAGVSLRGGVGEAGDGYERHADEVADAVVRGDSAEGLLDRFAGGGGGAGGAVQRKEELPGQRTEVTFEGPDNRAVAVDSTGKVTGKQAWKAPPLEKTIRSMIGPVPAYVYLGVEVVVEGSVAARPAGAPGGEPPEAEGKVEVSATGTFELGAGEKDLLSVFAQAKLAVKSSATGRMTEGGGFEGELAGVITGELAVGIRFLKIDALADVGFDGLEIKQVLMDAELGKFENGSLVGGKDLERVLAWLDDTYNAHIRRGAATLAQAGELLGLDNPYERREQIKREIASINQFSSWWSEHRARFETLRARDPHGRIWRVEDHNAILAAYRDWWDTWKAADLDELALQEAVALEEELVGAARARLALAEAELARYTAGPSRGGGAGPQGTAAMS